MSIGINWADGVWLDATWEPGVWLDTGVVVPDVVGQTQASGTLELETALFVVAVTTAYSSLVAAGDIISQSPSAGVTIAEGSTVTITVSLGEAPVVVTETGDGGFFSEFDRHVLKRRKRQQELAEIEEQQAEIADEASREIAKLLQAQERKDAERRDIDRIKALVARYKNESSVDIESDRVQKALANAKAKQSRANLERLQKEFERMVEEEDDLLALLFIALNE